MGTWADLRCSSCFARPGPELNRHALIGIRSIKAHNTTPDGIRLMRHMGFTEMIPNIPRMHDFTIDVARSDLPLMLEYKEALRRWQEQHKQS